MKMNVYGDYLKRTELILSKTTLVFRSCIETLFRFNDKKENRKEVKKFFIFIKKPKKQHVKQTTFIPKLDML